MGHSAPRRLPVVSDNVCECSCERERIRRLTDIADRSAMSICLSLTQSLFCTRMRAHAHTLVMQVHARRALDFLWEKRQRNSNLVGTTINIHSGEWVRRGEEEHGREGGREGRVANSETRETNVSLVKYTGLLGSWHLGSRRL